MKKKNITFKEYNFSKGVRGKYAARYAEGSNIVVLFPDVSAVFQNSDAVNEALRSLMKVAKKAMSKGSVSALPARKRKAHV